MNKIKDFTDNERNQYANVYADLVFRIQEQELLLGRETISERSYVEKLEILATYIELLDTADAKACGTGLMEFFKSDDQHKVPVLDYKSKNLRTLDKLQLCHQCKCSSCMHDCTFHTCHSCMTTSYITACDETRYRISHFADKVELYSHDEEREVIFDVLGILTDTYANKRYMYLVEAANQDNQHILGYVKHLNGTINYEALDEEVLDTIYEVFRGFECYA